MTPEQQAAIKAAEARLQQRESQFTPEQIKAIELATQRAQARAFDVVRTNPDGTQVLQFNDGSMQVLNNEAGLASKDPDLVNTAMRGESVVEASGQKRAEEIVSQAPVGARAATALQGVPFIGSYFDEMLGSLRGQESDTQRIRSMQEAMATTRPGESLALQLGTGVATGIGMAQGGAMLGAGNLIERISQLPRGKKYLSYLGLGGLTGGTEGAIYGYGTGETPEQGRQGAISGGLLGTAIGGGASAGLPAISSLLSKGYANLKANLTRSDVTDIAGELGVSPDAAKVIQSVVQETDSDLADMLARIERAGAEGMIADADIATATLLDAAAASGAGAATIAREAVEGRAQRQGQELGATMDQTVSPIPRLPSGEQMDVQDVAEAIARQTRTQRQAAYNDAYSSPIDYSAPEGRAIESIIGRIPPSTARKAIQEANDEMRVKGISSQIMADIDEAGNITFIEMPNTVQVDYLKRALDAVGRETDQFGRPTNEAARAQMLASELKNALGDAVPVYRTALDLGGDKIGRDIALEAGESALKTSVSFRDLSRQLSRLDPGQRQYARMGLRQSIESTINNVKATINSPDIDIKAMAKVLQDLSSKESQNKVKLIIGDEASQRLFRELEKANAALALRAAIAVNSKTAVRQAMMRQVDEITEPGAMASAMQGEPLAATREVVKSLTGATGEFQQAQKAQIMKEIARAMTSARGQEAKSQLRVIYDRIKENKATQQDIQSAYNFLINSITLPATMFGITTSQRVEQ